MAIYREADSLMAHLSCDASTNCCRFGVTGREPYVTEIELAEITEAVAAKGGRAKPKKRALEIAGERRCPMLTDAGKCAIYASRPLGCRTFFCGPALAKLHAKLPRADLQRLVQKIEALSERAFRGREGSRPLSRVVSPRRTK
ncbi:MAG: YkgJ family cysteine cluster protein [Polyangiaceae bacterium]